MFSSKIKILKASLQEKKIRYRKKYLNFRTEMKMFRYRKKFLLFEN